MGLRSHGARLLLAVAWQAGPWTAAAAEPEPSWTKAVEATGYAASRSTFTRSRTWGLLPTDDQPQAQQLLELNAQVRVSVRPRSYVASDLSLVANAAGHYRRMELDGREVLLDDRDSPQARPTFGLNELYAFHELAPSLSLLAGKKRITWGSGFAYNPTDLLNPRRDPSDPTLQRAGAWLAQLEVPLETMTFSVLFAPTVLLSTSGLPRALVRWPAFDERDRAHHFQLAARWYALVGDADVNVMLFYGNRSVDAFRDKLRVGLSFSRTFFTDLELHLEALVQRGSPRETVIAGCAASPRDALACALRQGSLVERARLEDPSYLPRVLVGGRRQFTDETLLSVEYLFQADGWTPAQLRDFGDALELLRVARLARLPLSQAPAARGLLPQGAAESDGAPSRLTVEPRGAHTLFLTVQRPRIADDFTASLVVLTSLVDLSSLWTASLSWSTTEWLTLGLYAFAPLPGPDALTVTTRGGTRVSEYGLTPFAFRAMFEARAFF